MFDNENRKSIKPYLVLDDLRGAEVDEVSASDIIPGSGSKSAALRLIARLALLDEGVWFGEVLGLALRPTMKSINALNTNIRRRLSNEPHYIMAGNILL